MDDAPLSPEAPREPRLARWMAGAGIILLAFNLRTAAVSVGPLLDELIEGLGMSPAAAGVLTMLPVAAFAGFGALASWLAQRFGPHRVIFVSLLMMTAGLVARSRVGTPAPFLLWSVAALCGAAIANVLLPSLIKRHFPARVGLFTSLYTTSLALGLTGAAMLTVPVARLGAEGALDWRRGLAFWAAFALVAAPPWLFLLRHDEADAGEAPKMQMRDVARTRLGWAMAVAFGLQSTQAYTAFGWFALFHREHGSSAAEAGMLLGLLTALSIPVSFVLPRLAVWRRDQRWLVTLTILFYVGGYLGMLFAPAKGAWLWMVLLGIGGGQFPLILTMLGLRTRTDAGTGALSAFAQSVGYVLAAPWPLLIGLLYDFSGGWQVPLLVLLGLCAPQWLVGRYAARALYLEDELSPRRARSS